MSSRRQFATTDIQMTDKQRIGQAARLKKIREDEMEMSQDQFSSILEITQGHLSAMESGRRNISHSIILKLAELLPGLNMDYLISGHGPIWKEKATGSVPKMSPNFSHLIGEKGAKMSPNKVDAEENLVMASERPGVYGPNQRSTDDFRKLLLPGITGKARTFTISGTSMFPVLRDGDVIVCIPADINQVEDGKVYGVVLKDLTINVKYAYPYAEGILMVPANRDEYHPMVIEKKEIREIWKAVLRLTSDVPRFGDIGAQQDLEKKIEQLEYFIRKMFPDYGEVDGDFGK